MQTVKLSVGEAIVKFLDNQYISVDGIENKFVDYAYAVFGHGCVLGAGEALASGKYSIKVLQGKNEQGMAHAATSYAKQSNRKKVIPCFSSIGPGAANMVTAAATATVNNIPLLLFPGDTFAGRQPDPVLQQVEQPYDLNLTTNDAFKSVVKFFDRINRPEQVMSALHNAMRVLTDPSQTGAVCIALPQDVQGECYDYPIEFFQKRVNKIVRRPAADEEINEAVELILKSKKPLLICGGGVRYSDAGKELIKFANAFNIPIAETQAGKGTISCLENLNLGGIGVTGASSANTIAKDADLVIGVGTRYSDFTTASKSLFSSAKIVSINLSDFHAKKLDGVSVVGDAKITLEDLGSRLSKRRYKTTYISEIENAKDEWQKEYERLSKICYTKDLIAEVTEMSENAIHDFIKSQKTEICQTAALALINKVIDKNAVVVGASGSLPGCMQRMWRTEVKGGYNMEYGYSCMGYEIAGALGAKLAEPDREVYALVGDGSFLMLHSEMHTAIQENVKINILLFDNGGFGCINNLQMSSGIDSCCTEFRDRKSGGFVATDYAKIGEGYGFKTYTARTMKELENALIDSKKSTLPTFIDIKVLPKTMTHGYGGWWNTGLTNAPKNEVQKSALNIKKEMLEKSRKY